MNCFATTAALGWVSNYSFSILKSEHSVRTEFHATRFSSFSAAVTFFRKDYGEPRGIRISHNIHLEPCELFDGMALNLCVKYTLTGSLITKVTNSV